MSDSAADEGAFNRQEQIWASLYGPAQAAELLAKARAARLTDTDADLKDIFTSVEPGDDDDDDDAGLSRPGVG